MNNTLSESHKIRVVTVIVSALVFGVLFAIRAEVAEDWLRLLLAACAFGVLGGTLTLTNSRGRENGPSKRFRIEPKESEISDR